MHGQIDVILPLQLCSYFIPCNNLIYALCIIKLLRTKLINLQQATICFAIDGDPHSHMALSGGF